MNIAVLYREMATTEKPLKEKFSSLAAETNVQIVPFNMNALDVPAEILSSKNLVK
jgi:enoyl-[acyl-carrier protein] reductase III